MNRPPMPTLTAAEAPKEWDQYWIDMGVYYKWCMNQDQKEYRKRYYAKKTEQRQILKLQELMNKYPYEVQQFLSGLPSAKKLPDTLK